MQQSAERAFAKLYGEAAKTDKSREQKQDQSQPHIQQQEADKEKEEEREGLPTLDDIISFITTRQPANTSATYSSRQKIYEKYCEETKAKAYSADVEEFSRSLGGLIMKMFKKGQAASTMKVTVAAVMSKHKMIYNTAEQLPPIVKKILDIASTTTERNTPVPKQALTFDSLLKIGKKMMEEKEHETKWVRDWALTLIMYKGLLRQSEVVDITYEDVQMKLSRGRFDIKIRKDKTSNNKLKKGQPQGKTVTILKDDNKEVCPIYWLEKYLAKRTATSSPYLFQHTNSSKRLSNSTPNFIVKRLVELVGLDPKAYGSHSLRRGGTTHAAEKGVALEDIRKQGGWAANSTTITRYVQNDEEARLRTAEALKSRKNDATFSSST